MAIQLNPDKVTVDAIRNRLKLTNNFCPCVPEYVWNDDYKCPCKKLRENEECCCGLFTKKTEEYQNVNN